MRRLSIGLFTYSTRPRGSVIHCAELADALTELGHDVTLYALDKDGEGFFRRLRGAFQPVPAQRAPAGLDALIAQRIEEVGSFVRAQPLGHDVLHAEDCLVGSALERVRATQPGALYVRTVHHVEAFHSPYLAACQERSIQSAELVFSVSDATAADVTRHYAKDSVVVKNGVDFPRFAQRSPARDLALRVRLGVPTDVPLVLSVGGVEERKNTVRMLQAFARAKEVVPAAHWLIAGGASILEHADYRAEFDAQLAALPPEVRSSVHLTGVLRDPDMPALYGMADVLLHAAVHEGFGLCVLEAMAAGRQVVVSRGAPFDELVDARSALQVEPTSSDAIAAALVDALSRPAPERALAAQVRARGFTWRETAERHVAAYLRGLDGAASAPRRAAPSALRPASRPGLEKEA
jgi:glycosyltransferase-like protein